MKRRLIAIGLFVLFTVFSIKEALALPTFARKYRTSCNTCHTAPPKLTAFGESFRLNGYQIPEGDEAYVKEEPVSLGAPAWSRVWPDSVWPGAVPGFVPISVRVISDFNITEGSSKFDFPHEIELMMVGLLGNNMPFFVELEFEPNESAWAGEAWLGFYDLLSNVLPSRLLNFKVGNLMVNPIPMAYDSLRIGKSRYLYSDWTMADSDNAFRLRDSSPGVEFNGIVAGRGYYSVGLIEGDNPDDKDTYFTLRYKFGGTAFNRSAPTEDDAEEALGGKSSGFWVDDAFELAFFGYHGKTTVTGGEEDEFYRLGVGLRKTYRNLDLSGGFIWGENDDPYGTNSTEGIDSSSWFAETNYVFFPWLIGEFRYETLEVETPEDYAVTSLDRARWVPGLIFQIRPNVKLVTEGLFYTKEGSGYEDGISGRLDFNF